MVRRLVRAPLRRNWGEDAEQFCRLDLNLSGISARRADLPGFPGAVDRAPVNASRRGGLTQPYCHGPLTPMRADAFARRRYLSTQNRNVPLGCTIEMSP